MQMYTSRKELREVDVMIEEGTVVQKDVKGDRWLVYAKGMELKTYKSEKKATDRARFIAKNHYKKAYIFMAMAFYEPIVEVMEGKY